MFGAAKKEEGATRNIASFPASVGWERGQARSDEITEQFLPTKAFRFSKRQFGSMGEERSFRAEWCDSFSWLHYDVDTDATFWPLYAL